MLEILAAPVVACLVLTGIHCYLGIHVVMREVIFVDLALAQIAAMGVACASLLGFAPDSGPAYACALGFTFLGAGTFALGRFRDRRVPQEAVIGIAYAVSSAVAILLLSKSAIDREEIEHMLVGRLLFVGWPEIAKTVAVYGGVAAIHVLCRRPFFALSRGESAALGSEARVRAWDFLFYATFGAVVTSSVQIAGVLLVFSFLIVPASCALMFFQGVGPRLFAGWALGVVGSVVGLAASAVWDLPTGASVVVAFGVLFLGSALTYAFLGPSGRHGQRRGIAWSAILRRAAMWVSVRRSTSASG